MKPSTSLWTGTFFLSVFLLFHGGHFYHVDEELHFLVAQSILDGKGGAIAPVRDSFYQGRFVGTHSFEALGRFGRDGSFYPQYGIGQPLAALPWAAAGRVAARLQRSGQSAEIERFVVSFFCPMIAAAALALLIRLLVQLGYSFSDSFATACTLAFATFYFAQAKFFMSHALVAALLVAGLLCARSAEGRGLLFVAGLAAGWIVLTRLDGIVYAVLVPLYWILREDVEPRRRLRLLPAAAFGMLAPVAALLAWNVHRFGHPFDPGYNVSDSSQANYTGFDAPFLVGFFGQLFNLQTGLVWYAPPVLLCLPGFRHLYRSHRAIALVAALGLLLPLTLYAKLSNWSGEISWGPRFLLPALTLLALTWAPVWEACSRAGRSRRLVLPALVVGIAVSLAGVVADHNRGFRLTIERIEEEPLFRWVPWHRVGSQLELLGRRAPDLWWVAGYQQTVGAEQVVVVVLFLSVLVLFTLSLIRMRRVTTARAPSTTEAPPQSTARG